MSFVFFVIPVFAGSPSGADTFQLLTSPTTGGDNTGDGGTGVAADFNYYYVGQTFTTSIEILSGGTTASNIWIDYDSSLVTASNLLTGTYFNIWSGQTINATENGASSGRVFSTGAEIPVASQSGTGSFGSVSWTAQKPTAAAYGTGAADSLDINVGVIGQTTESNISLSGVDLLDDEEDFSFHVWADTVAPFAENPSPVNGAVGVSVDANFTFDLRDTLNGEGNNTGVGTGVNTSTTPGVITANDGGGAVDYTSYDSYSCSGAWGTNLCSVTLNPPSPTAVSGDTRNWKYATTYTINIGGFQDLASSSQDQLGDSNGPSTMSAKAYTFTTEGDVVAPQVVSESPSRGSAGVSVSSNITINLEDRKTYPNGVSGVGIDISTGSIDISSPSFGTVTYQFNSAEVSTTVTDFGYDIVINPGVDFAENETVTVTVYNFADTASNIMTSDAYTFGTADNSPPYVDSLSPLNDASVGVGSTITFDLKDDGVGVALSDTVIFVNGIYYTDGGGSGSVTTSGTSITFTSSLNFNGSNYAGDTTGVTGTSSAYSFVIDPEADFSSGEAVPVIVYAKDTSGTLMERVVYAVVAAGGVCPSGATFCGSGTSWNGASCVSSSSGGSSTPATGYGGTRPPVRINDSNMSISQIDEHSVLVTWYSNTKGSSRVLYGTEHTISLFAPPNYGIQYSTQEVLDNSVYHLVVVDGLTPGTLYYFRPVTVANGQELIGRELMMAPRFDTEIIERFIDSSQEIVCEVAPPAPAPERIFIPVARGTVATPVQIIPTGGLLILNLERTHLQTRVSGIGVPNSTIKLRIY